MDRINELPWLPYMIIHFLDGYLRPEMEVFEWGTGSSTVWLSHRVARVVSIDHNRKWFNKLPLDLPNIEARLIEPEAGAIGMDRADPEHYYSKDTGNANLKTYVEIIDEYGDFDLILIDGRARPSCLAHAISHVRLGGMLVLDNTERGYYLEKTLHLFGGWDRLDVTGHGPNLNNPWQATIWMRV